MLTTVLDAEPVLNGGLSTLIHHCHLSVEKTDLEELEQTGVFVAPIWKETVMCPQIDSEDSSNIPSLLKKESQIQILIPSLWEQTL